MLESFQQYISSHNLFSKEDAILLAVSGGMDSVVLANLFYKSKFKFGIAHCNFCLRGEESDGDEEFVKTLAKKYKTPYYTEKFETAAFAADEKISIQMAARMLRYAWFEKILVSEKYNCLATAHHQNDLLETVILNFTRGTGISGFHGIKPKNGHIIRPMMFATREEIYDYVGENQLTWREDSSNENIKYQRNLVRHEVVPLLKKLNPGLEDTILQTVEKVTAVEEAFNKEIKTLSEKAVLNNGDNIVIALEELKDKPAIYLFELLKQFNFTYSDAKQIRDAFDEQAGKQFFSPTHYLVKDRDQLIVTIKDLREFSSVEISESQELVNISSSKLTFKTVSRASFILKNAKNIASLDFDKLKFPLKIRKWKEGDWFIPLGMNGKKKISDLLIDLKVPLNLKDKVKVMTSGDSIIWVIGLRIDDRFKVIEKTEKVYTITSD